jgi:hypothetical protein
MNAPGKIYINIPKCNGDLDSATWDDREYADCENVEYIRKDALMEWLKGRMDRLDAVSQLIPSSALAGKYDGMKEVIEKIESL